MQKVRGTKKSQEVKKHPTQQNERTQNGIGHNMSRSCGLMCITGGKTKGKTKEKERKDEEDDVSSYCMTLRKRDDTENGKREYQLALSVEVTVTCRTTDCVVVMMTMMMIILCVVPRYSETWGYICIDLNDCFLLALHSFTLLLFAFLHQHV